MSRHLASLFAVAGFAAAAAGAPPRAVPWSEAGAHVGEVVTVEGEVQVVRAAGDRYVLEFGPEDPRTFRAVLLRALFSDAPPDPERLYAGRRVRVSGRVQRFQGRPEMILRSAAQIEVVEEDVSAPPATTPPAAPAPVPSRPAPPAESAPPPAPAGVAPAGEDGSCRAARARWREAAAAASDRATALQRCVAAARYGCGPDAAALAPILSTLEAAARQVEQACP